MVPNFFAIYTISIDNITVAYGYTEIWYESYIEVLHLRARWYSPSTGTFLNVDPVESEPPYQYVGGNSVNWVDPSGNIIRPPLADLNCLIYGKDPNTGRCTTGPLPPLFGTTTLAADPYSGAVNVAVNVLANLGVYLTFQVTQPVIKDAVNEMVDIANEAWDSWTEPDRSPEPDEGYPPPPPYVPTPTRPDDCDVCDPKAFANWWNGLQPIGAPQPDKEWYNYEQRVARGPGTMGGNVPRRVPAGTDKIDADGADPSTCRLLDAKHSRTPARPRFRDDGPFFVVNEISDQIRRYRLAITTPQNVHGAQPSGLVIITNAGNARGFFEGQLTSNGFVLGIDGFVNVTP